MSKKSEKFELSTPCRKEVQAIANSKGVNIISFVAPQEAVRISPVALASAEINEREMFQLEKYVNEAQAQNPNINKLHLILHTPGGELFTSYKIADYLRRKFTDISVFVPYQAASGGTLLCCAANTVYLGELGNLTPVDPQIRYMGSRVSAYAFERAMDGIKDEFEELSPDEVPTPYQQIISKFDPMILDEMNTLVRTTLSYADDLLEKSGYGERDAFLLAWKLVKTLKSHPHVITRDEAVKSFGFHLGEDKETMMTYTKLVAEGLKAKTTSHVIIPFYPTASTTVLAPSSVPPTI